MLDISRLVIGKCTHPDNPDDLSLVINRIAHLHFDCADCMISASKADRVVLYIRHDLDLFFHKDSFKKDAGPFLYILGKSMILFCSINTVQLVIHNSDLSPDKSGNGTDAGPDKGLYLGQSAHGNLRGL